MGIGSNPIECRSAVKFMLLFKNLLIYTLMFPIFGIVRV